ncbi:hypothetical protein I7I50_09803 [Histoplasma capsulatum G186AR]|uniref:Uncharacterized protein n=1 Tax=Ajellomyces capsulatus TaxID=5037 RepID=A0A8H8D5A8_AJECA|nr:hypothetical protein I7I52_10880 [Histoplasma capsulatum]QSS68738.1 hypothetical protein I7I50_09803 [Histoplasma capsulatum G186AR]
MLCMCTFSTLIVYDCLYHSIRSGGSFRTLHCFWINLIQHAHIAFRGHPLPHEDIDIFMMILFISNTE